MTVGSIICRPPERGVPIRRIVMVFEIMLDVSPETAVASIIFVAIVLVARILVR